MQRMTKVLGGIVAAWLTLATGPGATAAAFEDAFREELYAGRMAAAADLARAETAARPQSGSAQAALGVAQFLGTVEQLVRSLHRYGLYNGAQGYGASMMTGVPFLRLPVPVNQSPEPVSYQALRQVLGDFGDGLAVAEQTLAGVGDKAVALELNLALIGLDLDGDGISGDNESLMGIFGAVAGPVRPGADGGGLVVDFDTADAVWLRAYAHLLMGMTDFLLAHDWEAAYQASFEGLFFNSFTPKTPLNDVLRNARMRMAELNARMPQQPDCAMWENGKRVEECAARHDAYNRDAAVIEMWALRAVSEYSSIADLIAFVHLLRWPVVEPDRLAATLAHLERTVALSRTNIGLVMAETDDGREWIPNPNQKGVFRTLPLDQDRIDGWLGFLDQIEAVLQGKTLLPHWRFAQGFNLRRMFLEPQPLDAVMLAHGRAVLPYLEDGPIADSGTWSQAIEVFGGDFFSYFIWIN